MTLRELILKSGCDETNCPIDSLGPIGVLEVQNESEFCRFALSKYFCSKEFKKNLEHCKLDFDDNTYNRLESYLLINRDKNGFSLSVERKFLPPPYSFD